MGLREYVVKRLAFSIVLIVFVATLNFIIFEVMPVNPVMMFIRPGMKPQQIAALINLWGLNQPVWNRYLTMMYNLLTGNFLYTISFMSGKSILSEIGTRVDNTLLLVGISTVLSMLIGIVLGVIAAYKRGSQLDTGLLTVSLVTFSLPTFWMGLVAILLFSIELHWFPSGFAVPQQWTATYNATGGLPPPLWQYGAIRIPSWIEITGRIDHLVLPVAVLTLFMYGGWVLLARASVLETITEDYVVTARAKGIKERTILFKHILKNASLPLITNAALAFGFVLSGAIITEGIFNYKGLGQWVYQAVLIKDFPVLVAMFFIIAVCVIVANFIADLLYGVIDPRVRYS